MARRTRVPRSRRRLFRRTRRRRLRKFRKGWGGPGPAFPSNRVVDFRYTTYYTFNTALSSLQEKFYNANSCYDPEASVLGYQPYGWDQWGVFYKRYVVLKSKITVEWVVNSNSFSDTTSENKSVPVIVGTGLRLSNSNVIPSAYQMCQMPATSYQCMAFSKDNGRRVITTAKFHAKNFFNVKDVKDSDDLFGNTGNYGGGGSNPAKLAHFQVFTGCVPNIANYPNCILNTLVTIDYKVLLKDPWELSLS